MKSPVIPNNDVERIEALKSYNILHTEPEADYDQLSILASQITNMPISFISFVDKDEVWFKSKVGMDICSSDRNLSFCSHAVGEHHEPFVVTDAKNDERFKDHPFVIAHNNPIVFYAGVCLVDKDGYPLGTLCVIDNKPNSLKQHQLDSLKTLAKQIVNLLELQKSNTHLKSIQSELRERNEELKSFAGTVSHDMKMPLANLILTSDILRAKYSGQLDDQAKDYLNYLKKSSFTLSEYISGLLANYESDRMHDQEVEHFDLHHLLEEIVDLLNINIDCEINFPDVNEELSCNRAALEQVFLNLIGNSLKYNDKDKIEINIDCEQHGNFYYFKLTDNGIGIPEDKQKDIFKLFATVGNLDRNGNKGHGIGLSTVQKLIKNLGGTISLSSKLGEGTTFEFSILK